MSIAVHLMRSIRRDIASEQGPKLSSVDSEKWSTIDNINQELGAYMTALDVFAVNTMGSAISAGSAGGAVIFANLALIGGGALLSIIGVGVALGAPYLGMREDVEKEWFERGFWRGFAAGLLDWKGRHVKELLLMTESKPSYPMDQNLGTYAIRSYFAGVVYGFAKANVPSQEKKTLLHEAQEYAGRRGGQSDQQRATAMGVAMQRHMPLKKLISGAAAQLSAGIK